MTDPQPKNTPREYPAQDPADQWRRLTLYAYAAIDQAIDSPPSEARAILAEAAGELDGAIDELDARAMGAEGAA